MKTPKHQLHWLPVNKRINFKILLYAYKFHNGLTPTYLTSCLNVYTQVRAGLLSALDVHKVSNRTLESGVNKYSIIFSRKRLRKALIRNAFHNLSVVQVYKKTRKKSLPQISSRMLHSGLFFY